MFTLKIHSLKHGRFCIILPFMTFMVIILGIFSVFQTNIAIFNHTHPSKNSTITVAIDAGHGGYDPGKVGKDINANQILEKDINLNISLLLKECLESSGFNTIMTRETDTALYDAGCHSKKTSDLNNRIKIIEDGNADIAICIHQNSFPDSTVRGSQVFYYNSTYPDDTPSKKLADTLQNALVARLNDGNKRTAKANNSYYMLKNTSCPTVIIECGFLSCPSECALLNSKEYQMQIAKAICIGINNYIVDCN